MQTVCLTMARLTEEKGCFRIFLDMEMPSAETIQSFPLVAGLVGVLIGLFKKVIRIFYVKFLPITPTVYKYHSASSIMTPSYS